MRNLERNCDYNSILLHITWKFLIFTNTIKKNVLLSIWIELTFSCELKAFHSFRSGRTLSSVSRQVYHAAQNRVFLLNSEDLDLPGGSNPDPGFIKMVCFWGAFKVDVQDCSLYLSAVEHSRRVS